MGIVCWGIKSGDHTEAPATSRLEWMVAWTWVEVAEVEQLVRFCGFLKVEPPEFADRGGVGSRERKESKR